MDQKKTYPIGVVSQKTGISASVIRAWERRYQAVRPARTESNRRLYSAEDIYRLTLLKRVSAAGMNIGDIAHLPTEQLLRMAGEPGEPVSPVSGPAPGGRHFFRNVTPGGYLEECLSAARAFQQRRLEYTLVRAAAALSQPVLVDRLLVPLIEQAGLLWEQGQFRVGNEHLVSVVVRVFLENLRAQYRSFPGAQRMIITTPVGQDHELGALLAAMTAASTGWNVTYLGPNLSGAEIAEAVRQVRAHALALSLVYPLGAPQVSEELKVLKRFLPEKTAVFIGGRATASYRESLQEIRARTFATIAEFRRYLAEENPG